MGGRTTGQLSSPNRTSPPRDPDRSEPAHFGAAPRRAASSHRPSCRAAGSFPSAGCHPAVGDDSAPDGRARTHISRRAESARRAVGATTRRRSRSQHDRRRHRGAVLGSRHRRATHRLAPAHRRHPPVRCAPPLRRWRSRALAATTCSASGRRALGGGWSGASGWAGPERGRAGRHDGINGYPSAQLANGSSSRSSARRTGSDDARHA
ncbi:MAG: hypothetical protein QOI48_3751 [Solirubrobacteraceae bacterium]|jgi:hypothetical protein|nr:hypothetical protein [Solirubrobacteraceae bacterium]